MEIEIAAAKINRYATSESGDTLEVVERPNGGISVVLADGQTHGKGAKIISTMVVRKVISLLAEGVRDGAAARAASDYLFTERSGKVSACLNILSIDLHSQTMLIVRNNPTPVLIGRHGTVEALTGESSPIGTSRSMRPSITEIRIEPATTILVCTDGVFNAGDRTGQNIQMTSLMASILEEEDPSAQNIADTILAHAMRLDQDRPNDDMSVVALRVRGGERDQVRRLNLHLPIPHL